MAASRAGADAGAGLGAAEPELIGRGGEILEIEALLDAARVRARALLIDGEPGIGKTRLWRRGVELAGARGYRCLVAHPGGADVQLAFTGLADLLREVDGHLFGELPPPQRRALAIALLLEAGDDTPLDERAIAAAFLGIVRRLAMRSPLLLAIDDLQWLDAPSARLVEFAVRRLDREPVATLVTARAGERSAWSPLEAATDEDRRVRISLRPLTLGGIHELIRSRLGVKLGRSTLLRIHETAGGNPLYALQLAEALVRVRAEVSRGEPLPVPTDLRDLMAARLARLSDAARETLLSAAALTRPSVRLVEAAAGDRRRVSTDLDEAQRAGVAEVVDSEVRFAHPLLASVLVASFPLARRRAVHRRLAEVAPGREERARHLALAADGPDEGLALELEVAGTEAASRGAIPASADLLGQAVTMTPDGDRPGRLRRTLVAAEAMLAAGDNEAARAMLEGARAAAAPGPERAQVLHALGRIFVADDVGRSLAVLQEAAREAGPDPALRARILCGLGRFVYGFHAGYDQTLAWAREAADLAARVGDRRTEALALARLGHATFLRGQGIDTDVMERAVALESTVDELFAAGAEAPSLLYADMLAATDETARARGMIEANIERARRADAPALCGALYGLAQLEFDAGRWDRARSAAAEALEIAVQSGLETVEVLAASALATVEGSLGDITGARARLEAALALATRTGRGGRQPRYGLGLVELSIDDPAAAWRWLEPAIERILPLGLVEPWPQVSDGAEALAGLGRVGEAERLLKAFDDPARRLGRTWALAAAARTRALIALARGDAATGELHAGEAVDIGRRMSRPLELGRSLLALGSAQRIRGSKRAARETLDEAVTVLAGIGAERWADRARREGRRIGGRRPEAGGLTATEGQIADLVGLGRSNKEIAASLHLSVKTVEWNLTRLYRKLGVESRTELALARHQGR